MTDFSSRIKALRTEREGLKQSEIATAIGVSTQSYSTYENGREPSYDVLVKLAKYFKCSTDFLLGRTSAKKPENETLVDSLGLGEKAIANIQLCVERGWATDDFISHTSFRPLMLNYTAYKNIDNLDYLDKKLGRTFHKELSEKQRKLLIRAEIDDSMDEILEDK